VQLGSSLLDVVGLGGNVTEAAKFANSIVPWLNVRNAKHAVEFYKNSFGAVEVYRIEDPDGNPVARLSVEGAEFWVSDESPENKNPSPETIGGCSVRIIFTVADPDAVVSRAVAAGAKLVFAVGEEHGWRLGRVVDPYGHHWEIGRPISSS
jgi:PhnB protein